MTASDYQMKYGTPPPITPPPTLQTAPQEQVPIQMTAEQYQAKYGVSSQGPSSYDVVMGIKNADGTPNTDKGITPQAFENAKKDITGKDGNLVEKGVAATADIFGAVGQLPILKQIGEVFGKGINLAGEQLSKLYTPEFQKSLATLSPEDYTKATQPLKDLQNLGTIANTILMAKGGEEGVKKAPEVVDNIKETASKVNPFNPDNLSPEQVQSKLKGVADDWAKSTTINEPKYNNARAVLEKDPEVPNTLAQNKINPFAHVEDGKYNTEDTAQKLRDDSGKLSKDLLRPSLQMADYTTSPTAIAELKPTIDDTFGVTADDAEAIRAKLSSKLDALGRKYPDGMSLTNILDEKITYDKNGGYKAFKSNADNIDAIANRAIADSLRETLGTKGEAAGIPVNDFQAELSKNYKAADYLDALHGKKAPTSFLQSVARYGAKVTGAKIAGMMGGGDLVSEFVGYHIGGALEKFVENMTNPMRDSFLKNLKVTNPEAFTKIEEYIKNNQK